MMGAMIVSWGRSVPGREGKALEVFGEAQRHWEDLEKRGEIVAHRAYLGRFRDAVGFGILEGDIERLQAVQRSDEFQRLLARAGAIVEDLMVDLVAGGTDTAVQTTMTTYTEALSDLGYL